MDRTLPRAWIVKADHVNTLPPLKWPRRSQQIHERTEAVLFPNGKPRDFLRSAVVETDRVSFGSAGLRELNSDTDTCEITHYDPQYVVVEANLTQPGLLVLSDAWYPGWKAMIKTGRQSHEAPIERTNRVFRGVWLSAGQQTVEFRYQPRSFYLGAGIGGLSWLLLASLTLFTWTRRRRA